MSQIDVSEKERKKYFISDQTWGGGGAYTFV